MSSLHFRTMAFFFKLRDFFLPRKNILNEVGIQPGDHLLDFGCGPGSYVLPASKLADNEGKIYALDKSPLAIESVQKIAKKRELTNVETILSDCETGLQDKSLDVILLYDTLHELEDPQSVLKEFHRVLKSDGILSLSDHHLKEEEILSKVTERGLFWLARKGKKTCTFLKEE